MEILECNKTSKDSNDHTDDKDSEMNEGLLREQLKRKQGDISLECKEIGKDLMKKVTTNCFPRELKKARQKTLKLYTITKDKVVITVYASITS